MMFDVDDHLLFVWLGTLYSDHRGHSYYSCGCSSAVAMVLFIVKVIDYDENVVGPVQRQSLWLDPEG